MSVQLHAPAALTPGEKDSDTHWIGGWVGPRAGLEELEKWKFFPPLGSNTERVAAAVIFLTWIWEVLGSNLGRDTEFSDFRRFPQSKKEYTGIITEIDNYHFLPNIF
jgi:hypothetical protein